VLLGNISDAQTIREKVSQLCAMVQDAGAIGFFANDSPATEGRITRHGVEASVTDGVILLTLVERGLNRHRFCEIYKLRNADHLTGRHAMTIGKGGITL